MRLSLEPHMSGYKCPEHGIADTLFARATELLPQCHSRHIILPEHHTKLNSQGRMHGEMPTHLLAQD